MIAVVAVLVACIGFASLIAVRSYRAARALIEPGPVSALLTDPGGADIERLESVSFESRGSQLAGWYVPSKNRAAVVVTHGVYSDRSSMLTEMRALAAADFGVLAFDWPGLGMSGGPIRWDAEAKDALGAAIDWLAARPDVDGTRIGGLGFSIGGFVLTQVAAKDARVRAVVIESAATEFGTYIDYHFSKWGFISNWPARRALRNSGLFSAGNSALRHIAEISPRPLLLIGETNDPMVPAWMMQKFDDAARPPKQLWLIDGAQHGMFAQSAGSEYGHRLQAFFEEHLLGSQNPSGPQSPPSGP